MRFTYYIATILSVSTVWAAPLDITTSFNSESSQELHARNSGLPKMLQPYASKLPAVRAAQVHEGSTHGEQIIIQFWSAADFRLMQNAASSPWHGITISERTCNREIEAEVKKDIETLIISANSGLRLQPGRPFFEFRGVCLAQWLPSYAIFELKVENGQGGKCDNGKCHGMIYLDTKHGFLADDAVAFYDTTEQADLDEFERRNKELKAHH